MITTTKKHWVNGYQVRGGWHHTLAFSLFNRGIMFSWGTMPERGGFPEQKTKLKIELYKLV